MSGRNLRPYKNFKWIVSDPAMLGGKPTIRGTRLSVALLLACLADDMTVEEIEDSYGPFPREAIPEILKAASELLDSPHVGASAIQCCHAAIGRRLSVTLTNRVESKNKKVIFSGAQKTGGDEKISPNVSRRATIAACMAGVRTSRPNFSAL